MTKKLTKIEMFQELSVLLARIESKIDKLQKDVDEMKPKKLYRSVWEDATQRQLGSAPYDQPCVFDNLPPEDRFKPMSISCPCKKCSPYCLSSGSLTDSGTVQTWRNDELWNDYKKSRISGDLNIE